MSVNDTHGTFVRPDVRRPGLRSVFATVVVVAAGSSLIFEQSPANEMLRTNAALEVLKTTGSAWKVGFTVAAVTVLIEAGSGLLITAGLHVEGGPVQRLKRRMVGNVKASKPSSSASSTHVRTIGRFATDVAVALGLGAGLVTMRRHVTDPAPSVAKDVRTTLVAAGIVATVSGMIGYLAAGGLANAERIGLATPARYVVDYGTDTRFWLTLLVAGYGAAGIRKLLLRRRTADTSVAPGRTSDVDNLEPVEG